MTRIVNLTPHPIVLLTEENGDGIEVLATFPSKGNARVKTESVVGDPIQIGDGLEIPTATRRWSKVEGLPAPVDGTIYIVSSLVLTATPDRTDLWAPDTSPGSVERNEKGQIVGVRRLTRDA